MDTVHQLQRLKLCACWSQEVTKLSETAGALFGWVLATQAAGEAAGDIRGQVKQRNACKATVDEQEAALLESRPVLTSLLSDLHALQVGSFLKL